MSELKPGGFLRRISEYTITLLLALSLNFFLPRAMPGDPLALIGYLPF